MRLDGEIEFTRFLSQKGPHKISLPNNEEYEFEFVMESVGGHGGDGGGSHGGQGASGTTDFGGGGGGGDARHKGRLAAKGKSARDFRGGLHGYDTVGKGGDGGKRARHANGGLVLLRVFGELELGASHLIEVHGEDGDDGNRGSKGLAGNSSSPRRACAGGGGAPGGDGGIVKIVANKLITKGAGVIANVDGGGGGDRGAPGAGGGSARPTSAGIGDDGTDGYLEF